MASCCHHDLSTFRPASETYRSGKFCPHVPAEQIISNNMLMVAHAPNQPITKLWEVPNIHFQYYTTHWSRLAKKIAKKNTASTTCQCRKFCPHAKAANHSAFRTSQHIFPVLHNIQIKPGKQYRKKSQSCKNVSERKILPLCPQHYKLLKVCAGQNVPIKLVWRLLNININTTTHTSSLANQISWSTEHKLHVSAENSALMSRWRCVNDARNDEYATRNDQWMSKQVN